MGQALSSARARGVLWQAVALLTISALLAAIAIQTSHNLVAKGLASGFGFLSREAGFEIPTGWLAYSATDTYARAIAVGIFNTLRVGLFGIVLATLVGLVVAVARLSKNSALAAISGRYVDVVRNIPLLLQLLFWYALFQKLPSTAGAFNPVPGVFLTNRGLHFPALSVDPAVLALVVSVILGLMGFFCLKRSLRLRRNTFYALALAALSYAVASAGVSSATPTLLALDVPARAGFSYSGGWQVSPEFATLLIGLSVYTSAFVAETIRAGILSVDYRQTEAANALGLSRFQTLRLVILPQAMRFIVPPLTSQYLNLLKNSSLAVAVGYPDLISVANTSINQTGQAVEVLSITMAFYLFISLTISFVMNLYGVKTAAKER